MGKLFWVGVGAAAGIFVYKRGQEWIAEAQERGLLDNVQAASAVVGGLASQAKNLGAMTQPPSVRKAKADAAKEGTN